MVKDIFDVTDFTSNLEKNYDPNFLVEVAGKLLKIDPNSIEIKEKIIKYLKEQKFQFYGFYFSDEI